MRREAAKSSPSKRRPPWATGMLVGLASSGNGDAADGETSRGARASLSGFVGAVARSSFELFASSHLFFVAGPGAPTGGFGVTNERHVDRAAKTPW